VYKKNRYSIGLMGCWIAVKSCHAIAWHLKRKARTVVGLYSTAYSPQIKKGLSI
jgi:hypothetical protein